MPLVIWVCTGAGILADAVEGTDEMRLGKIPEIAERIDAEMLTPSEIESLRRTAKEHSAYGRIAFKNHKVDLGVKDDTDSDASADANERDASRPKVV